ncbi:hypothetical protein RJT34_28305 [Clitoria ternatea]|uniref:Hydroxyproline-rich glycoprotein family protein n=1 Tax=Clitoria ternatea TaxID=43366 RepID=A0AAN9ICI0_CLITE
MEEEEDMSPPFWEQTGGANHRRLRRSYSAFLSSGAVVICIGVTALAFTFIIVPTLHSFTSHIFKPHSVKKSWDSLNLLLVLFAILCAFLSKNTNSEQTFSETPQTREEEEEEERQKLITPRTPPPPWYQYSKSPSFNRLRSFNSYPDLRQESPWFAADQRWRFSDDTHFNSYREMDQDDEHRRQIPVAREEEETKDIEMDSFVAKEVPSPAAPAEKRRVQKKTKSSSASETKELLTLKGKKKVKRNKSVPSFQSIRSPDSEPPPPSSAFHDLFSVKKSKHKKLNSVSSPPRHHVSPARVSRTEPVHGAVTVSVATVKPRVSELFGLEENVVGNESPKFIPIPPPPPPPPFKMPAWKFRVQGDFVRIDSMSSSSSGSPDLDDEVVESQRGGGESEILSFYDPNPDVDTKADTFIEKFRAGLRMEKINSIKKGIAGSKSNLRPWPTKV